MLTIKNIGKIIGTEIKLTNVGYKISDVWMTHDYYTFTMYSTTHSGWSQTIRLNRLPNENESYKGEKIYKFMDSNKPKNSIINLTMSYMKDMNNIISALATVIEENHMTI